MAGLQTGARLFRRSLLTIIAHWISCQAIINTSLPNYKEVYKPIDYAVVGQQKCGTSTLWNVLTSNPTIKWVGYGKESFVFNAELPRSTLCDNMVEDFLVQGAVQRLKLNRTDLLIGDWSATHFSCSCCPLALRTLNPNLKVVVVLRDPAQRAFSRFLEQKRNPKMPFHSQVVNVSFAEYTQQEVTALEACLARAAPLRAPLAAPGSGPAGERHPDLLGWGKSLDVGRWMEMQCFSRSNILGWSVYDVFLENYLAHFPQEQVLVLYTDDLSSRTLEVVQRVESFLGATPYQYDAKLLGLVYNSRECYHWRCARQKGELRTAQLDDSSSSDTGPAHDPRDGSFAQAMSRLVAFYRPHVQRLFIWAQQGRITQPPDAWRTKYG